MCASVQPALGRLAGIDLGILRPAAVVYSDGDREVLNFPVGEGDTNAIRALARGIARACDAVWVEDLDFSPKARVRNEALADWRIFITELKKAGGIFGARVSEVPAEHSSRICPICDRRSGKHAVQVRVWGCVGCRTALDRDYAAATNVLLRGEPGLREILGSERLHQLADADPADVVSGTLYEPELFVQLRKAAYSRRRHFTDADEWRAAVEDLATHLAAQMPEPVDPVLVTRMTASITTWSWTHITPEGFSKVQAERGRRGGLARAQSMLEQAGLDEITLREAYAEIGRSGGRASRQSMIEQAGLNGITLREAYAELGRQGATGRRSRIADSMPRDLSDEERSRLINHAMLGPGLTAWNEQQKARSEDLRRRILEDLGLPYRA